MSSKNYLREKAIEPRIYQEILANQVLEKGNSLVVAPTALGKTIVAGLIINQLLVQFPSKKILVLAPTKPLAAQHQKTFQRIFDIPKDQIELLTGSSLPKKRALAWQNACIISATPQAIENDVIAGRFSLQDFSMIVFDEAHRAIGDYAYVFLANRYRKQASKPLILGLTASPGSNSEKIQDVCKNLFIKNIEIKTLQDQDVKPYTNEINVEWQTVSLDQNFLDIKGLLHEFQKEQVLFLKKIGLAKNISMHQMRRIDLLQLQSQIRKNIVQRAEQTPALWAAVSRIAALLKISHAETLLETQGIPPLQEYFERLQAQQNQQGSSKAVKTILADPRVIKAMQLTQQLFEKKQTHPKQEKLIELLQKQFSENPKSKVIVFNHYRDSVKNLVQELEKISGIHPLRFVGQATKQNDKGLTQKEQIKRIEQFRDGDYNVLISSSVAEEGLDIPSVDLVIFYEPVPSEIRTIQRRGRTGRWTKGKCIILMARHTRDEAFYWSSKAKEKNMHAVLQKMQKNPENSLPDKKDLKEKQTTLGKYSDSNIEQVEIFVDSREQASSVAKELLELGAFIRTKQLEVGDYVLGSEIAVERKTVEDFLSSMVDGRLFNQLKSMTETYQSPLVILEGNPTELFSLRNIHKNAILGALSAIAINYRVPILFSQHPKETAEFLYIIAKREQLGKEKDLRIRTGRKGLTLSESQQFIIESLPLVGPTMAKSLLKHFKTVKSIVNANENELQQVDNMGEKKAKKITKLVNSNYKE
ncbi:DEAD/DEAH box helicase [Candidatus Micrarchaeota archaeon]|nr:DEAD/DEAH box helicase [Candidatus Micrarchaeota archaeon]MBU1931041.1 DEAD/DEAH box helicase [Candidatus Micrarchaeota archaeon]